MLKQKFSHVLLVFLKCINLKLVRNIHVWMSIFFLKLVLEINVNSKHFCTDFALLFTLDVVGKSCFYLL